MNLALLAGDSGSGPEVPLYGYVLMFGGAILFTVVGALKTFAPQVLLEITKRRRAKIGISPKVLEGVEKSQSWKLNQRLGGLVALGFGVFFLFVLVRSLLR